jgi:hypothetical protein
VAGKLCRAVSGERIAFISALRVEAAVDCGDSARQDQATLSAGRSTCAAML